MLWIQAYLQTYSKYCSIIGFLRIAVGRIVSIAFMLFSKSVEYRPWLICIWRSFCMTLFCCMFISCMSSILTNNVHLNCIWSFFKHTFICLFFITKIKFFLIFAWIKIFPFFFFFLLCMHYIPILYTQQLPVLMYICLLSRTPWILTSFLGLLCQSLMADISRYLSMYLLWLVSWTPFYAFDDSLLSSQLSHHVIVSVHPDQ